MSYILKGPDDKPILRNEKEVYVQDFTSEIKGVNLEKRTLTIIGTDETRDRDGDIIRVNGWILENYLKNPVFLWAHNYSSVPLGATSQLIRRRNPNRLEFKDIRFPTEGLNPFADMILNLYQQGIINASSVGFLPYKWQDLEKSENEKEEPPMWKYGREFVKQELLELSGCPVPSNPSALQNAIKNFTGDDILTQNLLNHFNKGFEDLEHKDDILEELRLKNEIEIIEEDRPPQVQVLEKIESEAEVKTEPEEVKEEIKEEIKEPTDEEFRREYYSERFGVDLSEKDFTIIKTECIDVVGSGIPVGYDGKYIRSFYQMNEGKLYLTKEEILDVKSEVPEGEGETKQEFSLSQADKEWLVQTIKEIVQANIKETPAAEAPQEPKTKTPDNTEMKDFQLALGRLRKVANEIEEVVKNATH